MAGLSPSTLVTHVSIIPPMLHAHSFIYHQRCIMFFSQHCSFPLSVTFHQCSILIHSPTTDATIFFYPSTSVSPVSIIPPMPHIHLFIYHRRFVMFFYQYFSFSCHSFHQCSILTHSSIRRSYQKDKLAKPGNLLKAKLFCKSDSIV